MENKLEQELMRQNDECLLEAFLSATGRQILSESVSDLIEEAKESVEGEGLNMEDFAENLVSNGYMSVEELKIYIDYKKLARDLETEYVESDGYIFRL